jgi:20S proteasome subunit beta 4
MTDSVIGVVGADFVLLASSAENTRSVLVMGSDEDKIVPLDKSKLLGAVGNPGDRVQFCEYIRRNIALFEYRRNLPLSTHAAAHYIRSEMATALRSNPYQVNMILAGFDQKNGPSLHVIDYLASLVKVDYGAQGYAGYFVLGLLDKLYKKNMTLDEGLNVIHSCIKQMQTRFVLKNTQWTIKVITKDGHRVIQEAKAE